MLIHPRSVDHKVFDIWRSPGRFTKNPDIVQLDSGRILLIYNDSDSHGQQEFLILTLLASDDLGRTWFKLKEVATADHGRGEERLRSPRISKLSDGRLVIICDLDDDGHFHEDQPPGNQLWWSGDEGETWEGPIDSGIMGFEPDRIIELPDGRLAVCAHMMLRDSQEFAEIMTVSEDGGKSWGNWSIVAHDGYHRFCEGAFVLLDEGKTLACVMRENHSNGIPSYVVFSEDSGATWSPPQMCPFAIHRPYVKELSDGRVLVTGRHVNGGLGNYGWVGDLKEEAGRHVIGGPRRKYAASLNHEALVIENRPEHECTYSLLPAEGPASEFRLEAVVKAEGANLDTMAFLSINTHQTIITIGPDFIEINKARVRRADNYRDLNFRDYRNVEITHLRGWLQVRVDDQMIFNKSVFSGRSDWPNLRGSAAIGRTQFGQSGEAGKSYWKSVSWSCKNRTLEDHSWSWSASSGELPDQYQRNRLIQIHGNTPEPGPDHGYSSWIMLDDGRVFLADYTNFGDVRPTCHLVGVYLEPDDLR